MQKVYVLAGVVALVACSNGMSTVSATPVTVEPGELFWAKNTMAERTGRPGGAQFRNMFVADLSNGDRVYCGEMKVSDGQNSFQGYVPFYMRHSRSVVKAVNWSPESADFSERKCGEARSGQLRINEL
ncbi:hypothetical protein [Shimia abyssi]|uniref:Beta/gamma crystallin n=1 Tax=Shimia abyssi TaxID=1662395 RepID=A0A2P8FKM0_9RHOB|nr:hypothetical protein [Shimia abyssi]PSL22270.1 hypothetical protein CLV88_101696 [Shimia abyssi]